MDVETCQNHFLRNRLLRMEMSVLCAQDWFNGEENVGVEASSRKGINCPNFSKLALKENSTIA